MNRRNIVKIVWWVYIALLFGVVIIKFRGSFSELFAKIKTVPFRTNYNLIPFISIGQQLENFSEGWARINILGNIIPFVPFGYFLPLIYKKINSPQRLFSVALLFILFIEIFQFITRLGIFDVDDIILNMFGILIGYFLYKFFGAVKSKNNN